MQHRNLESTSIYVHSILDYHAVPVMKKCHAVSILSALLFHLWNNQGKGAVAGGEGARRSGGRPTFLKLMKKNEDGSHRWQR